MVTYTQAPNLILCWIISLSIALHSQAQSPDFFPLEPPTLWNSSPYTPPSNPIYLAQKQPTPYPVTEGPCAVPQATPAAPQSHYCDGLDYSLMASPRPDRSCYAPNYACSTDYCGCAPVRNNWYVTAAALILGREDGRRVWTTYEDGTNANQLMHTQDADTDFTAGADIRIGHFFACNRWAVELGYWSVGNFEGNSSQTHPSYVSSPLLFNDVEFSPTDAVLSYYDNAEEHRIYRSNELHNVELNIVQGCACNSSCCRWSHRMLAGARFFKFHEDLTFATLDAGGTWGGSGGADEVYLNDSISNYLVGAQIGCVLQRQLGCRTQLIIAPKFGVYNNHIENRFDLRRGDGVGAMPSAASGVSGSYPVETETDVIAFLSEINLGLQYQLSCRCSIFGGYRVVTLNNVGLSDDQIPQYIVDIPEIADIDTDGSLILHGAYAGASFLF